MAEKKEKRSWPSICDPAWHELSLLMSVCLKVMYQAAARSLRDKWDSSSERPSQKE